MKADRLCYLILTLGMVSSASLLAIGLALYFLGLPYRWAMLSGITLLLFTPMAAVSSTIPSFFRGGERPNAFVSLMVVLFMLFALLLALFR